MKKKESELPRVIKHVCESWQRKKGAKYPFQGGKHGKILKWLCSTYEPSGVMALWDLYLESDADFHKQVGYTIEVFGMSIPKLVDGPWKSIKQKYVKKEGLMPVRDILFRIANG